MTAPEWANGGEVRPPARAPHAILRERGEAPPRDPEIARLQERLGTIGGADDLRPEAEILDDLDACAAEIQRIMAEQLRDKAASELADETALEVGRLAEVTRDAPEMAAGLRDRIAARRKALGIEVVLDAGPIVSAWRPLNLSALTEQPPPRRWLLRHPTSDGKPCAPGTGDGMLPLGKVGLLVSDGGIGKTRTLLALAVCIITGRKFLGHFDIGHDARAGRVLLALAEEDAEEVRRRLYEIAQAFDLTAEERGRVAARLVALPLAAEPVSLLAYDPERRTLGESAELVALRAQLHKDAGPDGWSLVALDPLVRWGGADTETDNAVATRTMQAAETLLEIPGRPTVLLAHHTSQAGAEKGNHKGNPKARGATGIRDGARWEGCFWKDGADVFFKQTKSNYSREMFDEIRLMRGPHGLLRAATAAEEQERAERAAERVNARQDAKDAAKDSRQEKKIAGFMDAIVEALRASAAPVTSQKGLVGLVPGDNTAKQDAVSRLLSRGRIALVGEGKGRHYEPQNHAREERGREE